MIPLRIRNVTWREGILHPLHRASPVLPGLHLLQLSALHLLQLSALRLLPLSHVQLLRWSNPHRVWQRDSRRRNRILRCHSSWSGSKNGWLLSFGAFMIDILLDRNWVATLGAVMYDVLAAVVLVGDEATDPCQAE